MLHMPLRLEFHTAAASEVPSDEEEQPENDEDMARALQAQLNHSRGRATRAAQRADRGATRSARGRALQSQPPRGGPAGPVPTAGAHRQSTWLGAGGDQHTSGHAGCRQPVRLDFIRLDLILAPGLEQSGARGVDVLLTAAAKGSRPAARAARLQQWILSCGGLPRPGTSGLPVRS